MKTGKKWLALLLAMALLVSCTVAGLALPAAAESTDTFKLAKDELYLAPKVGGYTVYGAIPALTLDGAPYEGDLTWTSSNTTVATIDASTGKILTTTEEGTTVITAKNTTSGEQHSCTVKVCWDGERVSGGDFESPAIYNDTGTYSRWKSMVGANKGEVVVEGNGNHVLSVLYNGTSPSALFYKSLATESLTTYKLSFDIKGDDVSLAVWLQSDCSTLLSSNITGAANSKWMYITAPSTYWRHVEFILKTTSKSDLRNYLFAWDNTHSGKKIYVDNVSLVQLGTAESIALNAENVPMEIGDETTLSVTASPENATMNRVQWSTSDNQVATVDKTGKITAIAPGTATITATSGALTSSCTVTVYKELMAVVPDINITGGTVTSDAVIGEVKAGAIVNVTVTPDEGFMLVPGSLKYTSTTGEVVRILNETWLDRPAWGRESAGNTFQFEMPAEKVTISAEFVSTEKQNFQANTVGTACRYTVTNGEKVYDGIRFLSRLNLANKFDAASDTLTVTYDGTEYTVLELGSLLKREQNRTELTYENAMANISTEGANRMWVSKAYTADSGVFRLVDYTDSYIDFASVMLTSYYDRFYTARGYIRMQDAEGNVKILEFDELTNSISTVVPILPPVQSVDGVTTEKSCWTPAAHTVAPGEEITYQIDVTAGETAGTVTVFEPIPANTAYVSGADKLIGKHAVWTVDLAANEKKTLTYTVKIADDITLCDTDGSVQPTVTQVGNDTDAATVDYPLYIERTVNKFDEKYFNTAMQALADSSYSDLTYVYWAYYTTYSNGITGYRTFSDLYLGYTAEAVLDSIVSGTGSTSYKYLGDSGWTTGTNSHLDNVAPTLYGGTDVTGQITGVKGAPAANVAETDLMIGDVLIVKNDNVVSLYIYCDKGLMKVKTTGGTEKADITLLDTLTDCQAYVVIRPRTAFKSTRPTNPETEEVELTDEQKAVIKTAEAFLMRGEKVQYADTKYGYINPTTYNGEYVEYRWRRLTDSPEDASIEHIKYTNCAAFCYDSYYFALNWELPSNMYTTNNMMRYSTSSYPASNFRKFYVSASDLAEYDTAAEQEALKEEFLGTLEPGDLMVIRRSSGSGHVMMYIGNGKMIHSSGANYRYGDNGKPNRGAEVSEPSIRYGQPEDYFFTPTSTSNYMFGGNVSELCILRPLDKFTKTIPENTINRLNNLDGTVAQKYTSHHIGKTVNQGDALTFTFSLRNTNNTSKVLNITDTVPAGTTYVSCTGNGTHNEGSLAWSIEVPANETVTFSYTVTVSAETVNGTTIASEATIGGVVVDCPVITVGHTLTSEEQTAIANAVAQLKTSGTELTNLELANAIYELAGLETPFAAVDLNTVTYGDTGVFTDMQNESYANRFLLKEATEDTVYRNMLAPTLFGGQRLFTPQWSNSRTQLAYEKDLVIGDIVIYRGANNGYAVYMYTGDDYLFSLTKIADDTLTVDTRLERLLGNDDHWDRDCYYFAVLRPSLVVETETTA